MTTEWKIMAAVVRADMLITRIGPIIVGILIGILFLFLWFTIAKAVVNRKSNYKQKRGETL